MIAAKLFAENKTAHWFSCNFSNVVPMYKAFNRPIFYQKMEKPFLNFAQEVTRDGDTVCLIVNVSPDTWYEKETGRGIPATYSWLVGSGINIPRSVSAIAFSLSKTGGVRKVFAFVGNNDYYFPEWYYPQDLSELKHYYLQGRDLTSTRIIGLLKRAGYKMWHPQLNNKGKRPDHVHSWWPPHVNSWWPPQVRSWWPPHYCWPPHYGWPPHVYSWWPPHYCRPPHVY